MQRRHLVSSALSCGLAAVLLAAAPPAGAEERPTPNAPEARQELHGGDLQEAYRVAIQQDWEDRESFAQWLQTRANQIDVVLREREQTETTEAIVKQRALLSRAIDNVESADKDEWKEVRVEAARTLERLQEMVYGTDKKG